MCTYEAVKAFAIAVTPLCRYLYYQCGLGNVDDFRSNSETRKIFVNTYLGFYNAVLLPEILRHCTPVLDYRATVSTVFKLVDGATRKGYTFRAKCNAVIPYREACERIIVTIDVVAKTEE